MFSKMSHVSPESDNETFKPRVPVNNEPNKDETVKKISTLKAEISTLQKSEKVQNIFSFDDIVEILEKENASLSKLLHYEETVKRDKLKNEKLTLSRDIEEEENLISACKDYVKNESFMQEKAVDKTQEMLLKLKILHQKLSTLLKKFTHDKYPLPEEESVKSTRSKRRVDTKSKSKKSVLHILKLLLPDLSVIDTDNMEPQELEIDKTMPTETIEFLLSADIIEKCPDKPNYIRLCD